MHSAPAVSYPVGRSRFQEWLILMTGLTGGVVGFYWHQQADLADWRQYLYGLNLLAACIVAIHVWRCTPQGQLRWDGQTWSWTRGQVSVCGHVTIHLDLQFVLLLSLYTETGSKLWLWPERGADMARWHALRRAVFSYRAKGPSQDSSTDVLSGSSR